MIERDRIVLPEPDSPTMPSVLPRSSVKRHAVDGLDEAGVGAEVGLEVLDLEQRPGLGVLADDDAWRADPSSPARIP